MVPKNSGWYPKWYPKRWCGHFLNLKNHENWSSYKACQGVEIPLGYYLGTLKHFGYHWVIILRQLYRFFVLKKIDFLKFSTFIGTLWVPNGTQSGTPMVPKIFSLKSMKSQLSKTVSNVVVRCLDPSLLLVEIL